MEGSTRSGVMLSVSASCQDERYDLTELPVENLVDQTVQEWMRHHSKALLVFPQSSNVAEPRRVWEDYALVAPSIEPDQEKA